MRTLGAALIGIAVVVLFPGLPFWRLAVGDVLLIFGINAYLDSRSWR